MKTFKLLTTTIFFITFVNIQQVIAQDDIKTLEVQINNLEDKISASEEILFSGVTALKRVKANLEQFKKSKGATKQEVARKEKLASSMQQRLAKLNTQIENHKEELEDFEKKLAKQLKRNPIEQQETVQDTQTPYEETFSSDQNKILLQKQELEAARKKLDDERKLKEIAYLKEQETLRLEEEKLNQLDNKIKEKEQNISKERKTLISDLEDDISINEEILISGKVGLIKMKAKLEEAKKGANTSKESIERKEAIIFKIEERLTKIQNEVDAKLQDLKELKE